MKILYFASFQNKKYPFEDIRKALLKLGHEVYPIDEYNFDMEEMINKANECDMFLFHHGGVITVLETDFHLSLARLVGILEMVKCKKVLWFLDKVWGSGELMMDSVVPMVDYAFFSDDTWLRRQKLNNAFALHPGCGEERPLGKEDKKFAVDIASIGLLYGPREVIYENLRQQHGRKAKNFEDVWEKDFDNACRTAKIMMVYQHPCDDFFWTDNIYKYASAGALILAPRLHGLQEEGWENGKNIITYHTWKEIELAIGYFTSEEKQEEREKIAQEARAFSRNFTYEKRLQTLFEKINESKS